ncbi:zinc-ribbon domain-containing protein, partial [Enterobacter cloacae]|uniref:zinc-ribbon domain-containing protein n=1 Tax=Enterobacter cloacae TaxID=550 RepID=UPI00195404A4
MKLFQCPSCREPVSFEHTACTNCGTQLVFDLSDIKLTKLALNQACRNREIIGCNWCVNGAEWY